MSCTTLKLKGCEIKGSTFQGRVFLFPDRDISGDTFSMRVRLRNSLLATVTGIVSGETVVFPFTSLEAFREDRYIIEYWATFDEIGTEMIAQEDFNISITPCDCGDASGATFTLSFPEEIINYQVNYSVVNIGGAGDVHWADIKEKPATFPPTAHTHAWNQITGKPAFFSGNYADLVGKPVLFSGNYNDLTNLPILFSGKYSDLIDRPALFSGSYTDLTNKPTIPAAQVNADWNSTSGVSQILNKPALFSGAYADLFGKPTLFSGAYADLTGKPTLFSGNYNDLAGRPALFSGAYADLTGKPTLFSGNYADLIGAPEIPDYSQQIALSTATVLSSTHNRKTLLIKANMTLTVPTGLPDGFEVAIIADGGNLTIVASGVTFKLNGSKTVLNSGGTAVLKKENGTTNYYLKGDLS